MMIDEGITDGGLEERVRHNRLDVIDGIKPGHVGGRIRS